MLKIIISYSIQVLLKRFFRRSIQKLALQRQDSFSFILHHEVSKFVSLGSLNFFRYNCQKKKRNLEFVEEEIKNIAVADAPYQLQVWTKLLLHLFSELLSWSSVAKSRGDICSFNKFSAAFKSDGVAFSAGSSIGFCWHFEDWSEPFDDVVLRRRLHSSGSDRRRYRTKLSICHNPMLEREKERE